MNDNDVLDRYRNALSTVQMTTPADAILARGDRRRRRGRTVRWATAGGGVFAAAVVVIVLLTTGGPSTQTGTQLAAFTISGAPSGASTLTLHKNSSTRLDPEALRAALAARGVTAKVTVGSWCDTATEPTGLRQAVTVGHDANGDPSLTIQPSAIPSGAELSIGYFASRTVLALIQSNAPVTCSTVPRQAAGQGPGVHAAIVIANG